MQMFVYAKNFVDFAVTGNLACIQDLVAEVNTGFDDKQYLCQHLQHVVRLLVIRIEFATYGEETGAI